MHTAHRICIERYISGRPARRSKDEQRPLPAKQPYLPASRETHPLPAAVRTHSRPAATKTSGTPPARQPALLLRVAGDELTAFRPRTQPSPAAAKASCSLPSMPRRFSVLAFGNHSVGTPRSTPCSPNGPASRVTGNESAVCCPRTQLPRICIEHCTSVYPAPPQQRRTTLPRRCRIGSSCQPFGNNSVGAPRSPSGFAFPRHGRRIRHLPLAHIAAPHLHRVLHFQLPCLRRSKDALHSPVDATPVLRAGRLEITPSAHHTAHPARQLVLFPATRTTHPLPAAARAHSRLAFASNAVLPSAQPAAAMTLGTLPAHTVCSCRSKDERHVSRRSRAGSPRRPFGNTSIGTASSTPCPPTGLASPRHGRRILLQLLPAHTAAARTSSTSRSPTGLAPRITGDKSVGYPPLLLQQRRAALSRRCRSGSPRRTFGNTSLGTLRGSPTRQADLLPASQATNPPPAARAHSRPPPQQRQAARPAP